MNENQSPDDLPRRLDALGDALQRHPRPDARIESVLGAGPPVVDAASVADVLPLPIAGETPRRRTAWVAVAAALALVAGIGLAAFAMADDEPAEDVAAPGGDELAAGADGETGEPAQGAADGTGPSTESADSLEEHGAWHECVAEQLGSIFEDGFSFRDDEFPQIDECGEPPSVGGMFSDGFGLCMAPHDADDASSEGCVGHGRGWFPFGELPDFDELCSSESTDVSLDVSCVWPPCPDDDTEDACPFPLECDHEGDGAPSGVCLDFSYDFGLGLEIDPEGLEFTVPFGGDGSFFFDPEMLPDGFPQLPEDFEFPRDLPELDEWFENFPWADGLDGLEGLFGASARTDA
jgi:hypothetical protein